MAEQNTYYSTLSRAGLETVQNILSTGQTTFIADGWYIALGIGETNPSLDTKDLANRIYDKYSEGYPGIRIEDDPDIGRAVYIQAPRSLQGNIITEMALFNADDVLMMSAKTFIDMSKGFEYGLNKVFDIGMSIAAIPANVEFLVINPPSAYPTYNETKIIVTDNVNVHNSDPLAHEYLARKEELIKIKTDVERLLESVFEWRIGKLFFEFVEDIDFSVSFIGDGKDRLIKEMPKLAAKWGTRFGGDGIETFGTPKLPGQFLRMADLASGIDPDRLLGSLQDDAMQHITGTFTSLYGGTGCIKTISSSTRLDTYKQTQQFYNNMFDNSLVARTANENRPKNIAVLPIFYFA